MRGPNITALPRAGLRTTALACSGDLGFAPVRSPVMFFLGENFWWATTLIGPCSGLTDADGSWSVPPTDPGQTCCPEEYSGASMHPLAE